MEVKERLFKELVKKGYSESGGKKVWNMANRSFMYMTDELANKFLEFRNVPWYKRTIVDIETALIKDNAEKFLAEEEGLHRNLIDLGCGDGSKAKVFVESLGGKCKLRFCPVNINKMLVDLALKNVQDAGFESVVEYKPHVADLESLGEVISMMRTNGYKNNVVLLLGSLLASFDVHDYLFNISQSMLPGDSLIIGNGIRTGERFEHLEIYKHTIFDEWLSPLMRGLGFEDSEIEHDARFANGRVEEFFKIKKDKEIEHKGKTIKFEAGDEIIVAVLYKYYESELKEYCKMYFRDVEIVTDEESEYALVLCKK